MSQILPSREPRTTALVLSGMSTKEELAYADETAEQECCALAKRLAPEDVQVGDFVTVLHFVAEVPSFMWCLDTTLNRREELVRLRFVPFEEGMPLRVVSACLPFVLVGDPDGRHRTLDLRRHQLARLDDSYARTAWHAYKRSRGKSRRKK